MAGGTVLAVCQSGGEFVKNKDGSLFYDGGEAHAIDIDRDMTLADLQSEVSDMFNCRSANFSIKYFLPNNKRTPITISSDKDLQRMVDFHRDSLTTDIYVLKDADNRRIRRVVADPIIADPDTPTDTTSATVETSEEDEGPIVSTGWDNLIALGHIYEYPSSLRDALHKYAVANNFAYRFIKNDLRRVTAECTAEGCPWIMHASRTIHNKELTVRKFEETHTCSRKGFKKNNRLTSQTWVVNVIKDKLQSAPNYKVKEIIEDLEREYGLHLNYQQALRGIYFAEKQLQNPYEEACSQLPWLCQRILETNPGSMAKLEISNDSKFNLFVAFHACLIGFEQGCRPLLFLDAVPLITNRRWKLLIANAVDGENCIFPVGFSVVDDETRENWRWFLVQLKSALSTSHNMTFISIRENGLAEEVAEIFEASFHGYCLRHLFESFNERISLEPLTQKSKDAVLDNFSRSVYTCKVNEFTECIESIKSESKELSDWILATKPELWSNALFKGLRYGMYSLNASDTVNSWFKSRYEASPAQTVDMIRCKLMDIMYTRRQCSNTWQNMLTPTTEQTLQEEVVAARELDVICSTGKVYEVRDASIHIVNIDTWECTCRKWQVMGLPCVHALAVLDRTNECIYNYCSKYFTRESYRLAYASSIVPIPDNGRIEGVDMDRTAAKLSHFSSQRGPKRKKEVDFLVTKKRKIRCTQCQSTGHNKRYCKGPL